MLLRKNTNVNPPQMEFVFEGKLVSINAKKKIESRSVKRTKFCPAVVKITNEDGSIQEVDAFIWNATRKANKAQLTPGSIVTLSTVADKNNSSYGRCWIELGGGRKPILELLAGYKSLNGNSELKTESVKSILKKNVIADADVI